MKVRVTIDGRPFEVEVLDPHARPVVALVDGERFEVWPEEAGDGQETTLAARPSTGEVRPALNGGRPATNGAAPPAAAPSPAPAAASSDAVLAPIPGVIVSVGVTAGQRVTAGQELLVLEAMKMQNSVRAPRDGVVGTVRVAAGQHVRHREPLLEYAP